ncbi:hypothetical protein AGLY_003674 [Aphis glycines]|uniref:Uncharacterized protein n=1 Tax=Aphis glycines TaxID=307491 RepID=A0A6G0TYY0_APHGL|nr:hypothetical protein AGLY_003674 [Aphis glycines]
MKTLLCNILHKQLRNNYKAVHYGQTKLLVFLRNIKLIKKTLDDEKLQGSYYQNIIKKKKNIMNKTRQLIKIFITNNNYDIEHTYKTLIILFSLSYLSNPRLACSFKRLIRCSSLLNKPLSPDSKFISLLMAGRSFNTFISFNVILSDIVPSLNFTTHKGVLSILTIRHSEILLCCHTYNLLYLEYLNDYYNGLKYACCFFQLENQIQQIFHKKYETKHHNCLQNNENNCQMINCILRTIKYSTIFKSDRHTIKYNLT